MQLNNQFVLELDGIDVVLIQEVQPPDVEFNVVTYGTFAGLPDIKQSGKKKVGEMTLKKLRFGQEKVFRDWLESTAVTTPSVYARNYILREINNVGTTVAAYICIGAFPSKITHSGFKRADDAELVMEEVTMSMTYFRQLV